jgi:hypothetical protein
MVRYGYGPGGGRNVHLQIPFAYSGDPSALGTVTVTLTNSLSQISAPVTGAVTGGG